MPTGFPSLSWQMGTRQEPQELCPCSPALPTEAFADHTSPLHRLSSLCLSPREPPMGGFLEH